MREKDRLVRITKKLHELYPGKYITVGAESRCFDTIDGGRYEYVYEIYVADTIKTTPFKTLNDMDAFITAKQIDAEGEG